MGLLPRSSAPGPLRQTHFIRIYLEYNSILLTMEAVREKIQQPARGSGYRKILFKIRLVGNTRNARLARQFICYVTVSVTDDRRFSL